MSDGDRVTRLTFSAQAMYNGMYGVFMSGGIGTTALNLFAPGYSFVSNILVGGDCSQYPTTTLCPSAMPGAMPLATDGTPIGADMARVNSATARAVVGP